MKQLWLIYFESANYAGYGEHCLVEAEDASEAEMAAECYANEFYQLEDGDQYRDEYGEDDYPEAWATILKVERFDETHECWKFYKDPDQAHFYPKVN